MPRKALDEILDRSLLDEDFRQSIEEDPEGVLKDFDLSDADRSALLSRNLTKVAERYASFYCMVRFAITEHVITIHRPSESQTAELQRLADEIVGMKGDRTEPIKRLLAHMRS